jgi:threonine dehydratase
MKAVDLGEIRAAARAFAAATGAVFVHPYDDPLVVAGQGTVALEMLEQVPDRDVLVVPVGGGGLIAGIAVAARALRPTIEVIGVESECFCAMAQRLAGLPVSTGAETVAKTVAEGLAAIARLPGRFAGRRVGVPLTGGNVDLRVLSSVLLRGLAADGRLSRVAVPVAPIGWARWRGSPTWWRAPASCSSGSARTGSRRPSSARRTPERPAPRSPPLSMPRLRGYR